MKEKLRWSEVDLVYVKHLLEHLDCPKTVRKIKKGLSRRRRRKARKALRENKEA